MDNQPKHATAEEDDVLIFATPNGTLQNASRVQELVIALDRLAERVGQRPTVTLESYRVAGASLILLTLEADGDFESVSINIIGHTDIPTSREGPYDYSVADATDAMFLMAMLLKRLGIESLPILSL